MTLSDIKNMEQDTITPSIAAQVLKCDPHWIRVAAKKDKSLLGFPVVLIKRRRKTPAFRRGECQSLYGGKLTGGIKLRTPEQIMRKVTQQAMENHNITSETKMAAAVGCGQGSIAKLLNEAPVKLTQEQWFNLCTLAGVLNVCS